MQSPVNALFALDNPALRARFGALAAGFVTIDRAYDAVASSRPEVVVVDDSSHLSVELCRRVRADFAEVQLVMVTAGGLADTWYALCCGAFSVVEGRVRATELHSAAVAATHGEASLDPTTAGLLLAHLRGVARAHDDPFVRIARLTGVEEAILDELARERSIRVIATKRKVTPGLVRLHLGYAVTKLHHHTLATAATAERSVEPTERRVEPAVSAGNPGTST